jgi:hypothetical protein
LQQELFGALQELDANDIDISVCVSDLMTLLEHCTRYNYTTSITTTAVTVPAIATTAAVAAQSTLQLDSTAVTNIAILMRMWEHPTATVRANAVTALQFTLATATATATAHDTAAPSRQQQQQQQQQQATSAKVSAVLRAVLHRCLWGMLCDNDATSDVTASTVASSGSSSGARAACLIAWQYFLNAAAATAVLQDSSSFDAIVQIAEDYYYTADDKQCLCPVYNLTFDSNDSDSEVCVEPVSKAAKTSDKATASRSSGTSVTDAAVTVTRQHGTGVTYASRALVREALVQLVHHSGGSSSGTNQKIVHSVVQHAVAQSQQAAYAAQCEAALLLLTACIRKWQQCDSDTAVAVQSETRDLISERITALLTAIKTEPTAASADSDSTDVSNE